MLNSSMQGRPMNEQVRNGNGITISHFAECRLSVIMHFSFRWLLNLSNYQKPDKPGNPRKLRELSDFQNGYVGGAAIAQKLGY